jgi:hypothetical protein
MPPGRHPEAWIRRLTTRLHGPFVLCLDADHDRSAFFQEMPTKRPICHSRTEGNIYGANWFLLYILI